VRGTILGYDSATGEGVITDLDGGRVGFVRGDWKSPGEPLPGRQVDFEIVGGRATGIFVVPGTAGALAPNGGGDLERRATIYGGVSLTCGLLTYLLGPLGLVTVVPGLIFGVMGKNAGSALTDRTGYYLSVAGLVLSAIALVLCLAFIGIFAGFLGLLAWFGSLH